MDEFTNVRDLTKAPESRIGSQDILNLVRVLYTPKSDDDRHVAMIAQRHYNAFGPGGDIRKADALIAAQSVKSALALFNMARNMDLEVLPVERLDDHR